MAESLPRLGSGWIPSRRNPFGGGLRSVGSNPTVDTKDKPTKRGYMKRIAGLLIMASVLTGCGNTAAKPAQPTLNKDFQTMGDLVSTLRDKGIECTYTKSSDVLIVLEEGNCSVNGKDVTIDLFPSDASAKQTLDAYGSLAGGYTFADYNWIMNTDDSATAKAMSETLGLKVKT